MEILTDSSVNTKYSERGVSMTRRTIQTSFVLVIFLFLLCFSTNVFASQISPSWPESAGMIHIIGKLKKTDPNTCTFQYNVVDFHGTDITSQIPGSDINISADVSNAWGQDGSGGKAKASFDPRTGTGTLTYNFADYKYVTISLGLRYGPQESNCYSLVDNSKKVDEIHFVSDSLTKTGTNTATFQYKIINFINDITKEIPASQIDAVSSLDSKVALDPSTGTGTMTFNSLDIDTAKTIKTTLTDKLTGVTAVLNTLVLDPVLNPVQTITSSEISRISFVSGDLTKTGTDTVTFQYKVLDHYYKDITKTVRITDLNATALIGSSKADITLDPSTGIGTITYDFSKSNQQVLVSLMHEKGIGVSALLDLVSSELDNTVDSNKDDLKIAQISFAPTDMITINSYAQLQYQILNKEGKDITPKIPATQLALSSSVNSMIALQPKDRTFTITYNLNDSDKTIIVSLADKETGVNTALNIGNIPSDPKSNADMDSNNTSTTSPTVIRLAGFDRYETASQIAKSGWSQSDYAIIAFGENYPDALSSAPLAKKYNAPILLTTSSNLPSATKQTLIDLEVKNVFIIGGTGVIFASVESELQTMGIKTTRIFGNDKYDTAIKVAQQTTTTPSTIFVVTGEDYPDALSVASIASIKQIPIILVPNDSIPDSVKNYFSSINVSKTYVIGYSDIISDNVFKQFPNAERILGADKYARNIAVNQLFKGDFKSENICVATGEGFADALTSTAYCAKISEPIILINYDSPTNTKGYYQQRLSNASNVYVFGGTGIIPDSVMQNLNTYNPSKGDTVSPIGVRLNKSSITIGVGSETLSATLDMPNVAGGLVAGNTNDVAWTSSNLAVATVRSSGSSSASGSPIPSTSPSGTSSENTDSKVSKITINSTKIGFDVPYVIITGSDQATGVSTSATINSDTTCYG